MRDFPAGFLFVAFLSGLSGAFASDTTFTTGADRVSLLELYTSEGCSSCPPAERWFTTLRTNAQLWKSVVPVAFHVDYWDHLGWRDSLASAAFTGRQRAYAASWGSDSVYTPEFVLDGKEWRERNLDSITRPARVGVLTASLRETGEIGVLYVPVSRPNTSLQAHAALLALGVSSDVQRGENAGRKLVHDFAAIRLLDAEMREKGDAFQASFVLPAARLKQPAQALAIWITETGRMEPLQAVGGTL